MTLVVVALISVAVAQTPTPASLPGQPCTGPALVGTWTGVESTFGGDTFRYGPDTPTAFKHVTPTHFVVYQVAAGGTNAVEWAHGGLAAVAGGTSTEKIQHGFGNPFSNVKGQSIAFQCSVEGNDRWHVSGTINGTPIRETWKRVSAEPKP